MLCYINLLNKGTSQLCIRSVCIGWIAVRSIVLCLTFEELNSVLRDGGMMGTCSFSYLLIPTGSNQGEATAPNNPVMCWLMKCLQGIRWCRFYSTLFTLCMYIFLWHYLWRCFLFLLLHDLKGLTVVLCRQSAPLMLSMQPVMNSILLYLFCALFDCFQMWRTAPWHNTSCVQPMLYATKKFPFLFVLSSNFMQITRTFILHD